MCACAHLRRQCAALGAIAEAVTAKGIKLIFNTHLLDTVPQGIDGAYFVEGGGPDVFNVSGGDGKGVWRSRYKDVMVRGEIFPLSVSGILGGSFVLKYSGSAVPTLLECELAQCTC